MGRQQSVLRGYNIEKPAINYRNWFSKEQIANYDDLFPQANHKAMVVLG